ncbi:hypothetical protein E5288_WYG022296 [Bos mutus]|uniref:Uncharacterized protein n=1 Tax=Bos mutus TaxID=72004 RepID=A0A6B0RU83_9CETA|nr:hypothetical protein [Bos mutus]
MVVDLASDSNHGDGGGGVGNHGDGGSDSGSGDAPRIDGTHDNHQEKSVAFAVMEMLSHPSRSPKHGRQTGSICSPDENHPAAMVQSSVLSQKELRREPQLKPFMLAHTPTWLPDGNGVPPSARIHISPKEQQVPIV